MKIRTENHGVFDGQWQWSAIDEDNGAGGSDGHR